MFKYELDWLFQTCVNDILLEKIYVKLWTQLNLIKLIKFKDVNLFDYDASSHFNSSKSSNFFT